MSERVRIDVWIWAVRLVKTRAAATEACRGGHVKLGGQPAKAAKRSASALQLDDAQQGIFQALRSWRAGAAKEQSVPAYVVFNDKTLAAIAERRPATIVELSTISGVGESKLERYGEAVLAVLAEA